ncbi:GIP [Symbiodinium sp. CCMP2456]|nr:GIP [Symbiodinium sp. CCMP2456]
MKPGTLGAIVAAVAAALYGGVLFPQTPSPADPDVSKLSQRFTDVIGESLNLRISCKGQMVRDRDTFFWSLFTDKFGSNPNTPYMWNALPAFGFLLPSPMWNLRRDDAVVLIARRPPDVEYFSFTTFALWIPRRGLQFSSLGDSVNNLNIRETPEGLFAHVVTANQRTFDLVQAALVSSGLPSSAINLAVVPSDIGGLFDDWTHFETVLRLFRFANQSDGDAYLHSHHPVYYLKALHDEVAPLPTPVYKGRHHPRSVREGGLQAEFDVYNQKMLAQVGQATSRKLTAVQPTQFEPLMIQGLQCLQEGTECLGDCPDAAYFGPNILEDSDVIDMLEMSGNELHLVSVVNHRLLNASIYGSVAVLKSARPSLSKTHMSIRATSLGVTSFDFPQDRFVTWAFTRTSAICEQLGEAVAGCSVVEDDHVERAGYLTYCERVYLNPITGTGPDWQDLISAVIYRLKLDELPKLEPLLSSDLPSILPPAVPITVFNGTAAGLHFLHVVKTGGESLELHLANQPAPSLAYGACRAAAAGAQLWPETTARMPLCLALSRAVTLALCAANCECCATDVLEATPKSHGPLLKGTVLRSPRSHVLSLFSHCHMAHHNTWKRMWDDLPQYAAEGLLRATEAACDSHCTHFKADPIEDLRSQLEHVNSSKQAQVQVIPFLRNMQTHVLTCRTSQGSLGQHFRDLHSEEALPSIEGALETLRRFDWVGLTDLFEQSICLLHFQSNGSLPRSCDCSDGSVSRLALPKFTHGQKAAPGPTSEGRGAHRKVLAPLHSLAPALPKNAIHPRPLGFRRGTPRRLQAVTANRKLHRTAQSNSVYPPRTGLQGPSSSRGIHHSADRLAQGFNVRSVSDFQTNDRLPWPSGAAFDRRPGSMVGKQARDLEPSRALRPSALEMGLVF